MSQQNVETMRRAYDAFNRGDIPAVLQAFDDSIDWNEPGGGNAPAGSYRGSQNVANEVFATIPQNFEVFTVESQQFIDAGDDLVVVGRFSGRSKSGQQLDAPFAHLWGMQNGKAQTFRHYVEAEPWAKAWSG